ncbi:MAG TPA: NAD(P)-dependent oxidoreductase [Chthoniobacterales bacterium]|nr:NAD(P)-dependent oxidoreductase [Chthoniobacterales bacterium]
MKLLITGSTGFVGRNLLLQALRDPTWSEIILPVRNKAKLLEQLKNEGIELERERLHLYSVENNTWSLSTTSSPDVVIHCAGLTYSRERSHYFETHVQGTLNLLKNLPTTSRLLVLSSLSAAGPTPTQAQTRYRHHTDEPISWYGESKLAMEKALEVFPRDRLLILRPPIILGPRDTATTPLFQMARGLIRMKPGLKPKEYSWIDVDDLCQALLIAAKSDWHMRSDHTYFLASDQTIFDRELLKTTAEVINARGITVPLPHLLIKMISALVEQIPSLHQPLQSLGRDRVKEILPQRWVLDGSVFQHDFHWKPQTTLRESLERTAKWLGFI